MLLKFFVSNFKSIGTPVEFTMIPTNSKIEDKFVRTIDTRKGSFKALCRSGLFGPNASGKSAFVQAIRFARDYIVNGQKSGQPTNVNQFKGSLQQLKNLSVFKFVFYWEKEVYEYGFSLDAKQVHEEHFSQLFKPGFRLLFKRLTDASGKTMITIKPALARKNSDTWKLINILSGSIQENQKNQLFLYKLYDNGVKKAQRVMEWFLNLKIIFPDSEFPSLPIYMNTHSDFCKYAGDILDKLDTGVVKAKAQSLSYDFDVFAEKYHLPGELRDELKKNGGTVGLRNKLFVISDKGNKITAFEVKLTHSLTGKDIVLDMDDESDGTRRLLYLMPMLFTIDKVGEPCVYCIDELERSLHTKLSQFILDRFLLDKKSKSQIIFTSHDVNLINLNKFDQNEFWFIEKNNNGETRLTPLSDYTVNKDQNVLKDYLNGRFGAVPMIKEYSDGQ